jgi:FkbM family methyltransferase
MLRTLLGIVRHPLCRDAPLSATWRFLSWQLGARLVSAPVAMRFAGGTRLLVRRGMTGATGNIYCGLHEFADMAFVIHALRPGDLFVDVGANVGCYSVLAAGVARADCIAIEPAPATFEGLLDNVRLNDLAGRVVCINVAVGGASGTVEFTTDLDTVNHVRSEAETSGRFRSVSVETLDAVLADRAPTIIKIDVEGFETRVIDGATRALRCPSLLAVLMELNGSGTRYGFDEIALHQRVLAAGFRTASYDPQRRSLGERPMPPGGSGNMLYVRAGAELEARLSTAPAVSVLNRLI